MINSAQFDQKTLAAVKPGLNAAFTDISENVEKYLNTPASASGVLETARNQLKGLLGVLKMAGLEGLAIFCAELDSVMNELAIGPQQVTLLSREVLKNGLTSVTQYLDALAEGADNATLNLFHQYQALQQLRGLEMSFKLDLFYPNLVVQLPSKLLAIESQGDSSSQLKLLRSQYQQGLMRWLRQDDVVAAAQQMQQAVEGVIGCMPQNNTRAFWWISQAFLECVKLNDVPEDVNVRKLLSRIDQQMRAAAEGKSGEVHLVLNEMLYIIGNSQILSELAESIKATYSLKCYLPNLDAPSFSAVEKIKSVIRERLQGAQESWERTVQGDDVSCEKFKAHIVQLVMESGQLDQSVLQPLAKQIQALSVEVKSSEQSRVVAIDMAMALLLMDSGVKNYNQIDSGFQEQAQIVIDQLQDVINQQPENLALMAQLIDLNFQMNQSTVTIPLANEMLVNLQRVEQGLNTYFNDVTQQSEIPQILKWLSQIHGGLHISALPEADQLILSIQRDVNQLSQNEGSLKVEESTAIADAIGRLENYIHHLAHGQAADISLLVPRVQVKQQESLPPSNPIDELLPNAVIESPSKLEPVPDTSIALDYLTEMPVSESGYALPETPQEPMTTAEDAINVTEPTVAMERPIIEDQELLDIFLEEAQEVIATIHSNLDLCLAHPDNHESLVTIRRGFHTFKGSGRMVGLNNLGDVAWNIERALNNWLQNNKTATPALLNFIESAVQTFAGWVEELSNFGGVRVDASALNNVAMQIENGQEITAPGVEASIANEEIEPLQLDDSVQSNEDFDALLSADTEIDQMAVELAPEAILNVVDVNLITDVEPTEQGVDESEREDELIVIGDKSLSISLFNIASAESMENVSLLQAQFDALRTAIPTVVQYDFMRAAHTLVGLNQAMGFTEAVELAHALETWSRARLGQPLVLTADQFTLLETAITALGEMVLSICNLQAPQSQTDLVIKISELGKLSGDIFQSVGLNASEVLDAFSSPQIPPSQLVEPVYVKSVAGRADDTKPEAVDEIDAQLLPVFLEEADELCPLISDGLRSWRDQPENQELSNLLKRQIHTMKGSSRMVGAMRIGEIAHEMEDYVSMAATKRGEAKFWDDLESYFDDVIALVDELKTGKKAVLVDKKSIATPEAPALISATVQVESKNDRRMVDPNTERAAGNVLRVRSDVVDRLVNDAGEMSVARSRIETELRGFKEGLLELTSSVSRLRQQLREVEIHAEGQMQARVSLARDNAEKFDPLEFDRFTRLQELTRFMNESVHDVQTVQQMLLKKLDDTATVMHGQARLNREMQQRLMSVRMVSFNSITDRLYRVVRQTGKELNKRANLELKGTNAELDRSVLEKMVAPFEHLLRNAIVHGLESNDVRAQSGKSPIGEICLSVRQESNEVVFEFSDDGAGLNYVALRTKAIAGGLLQAGEDVSDDQLAQLIFTSGLSTAAAITEIAGRGVGMDVVRSEITGLGGRIDVSSKRGLGTQFTIYLPLTLAVTQIVLVRSGEHTYAIPSAMVEQVRQIKSSEMAALHQAQKIEWQDKVYPLHYLSHLLRDGEFIQDNQPRNPLLLLRSGEQRYALHVDELLGNQEAVVKNIGPQLARHAGITGATVLGNGVVVMILNPAQLAQRIGSGSKASRALAVKKLNILPLIMVVDDSLTVRKITTRMLTRAGYQVVTATDGVDALEQLEEFTPDVMLLDIEMPRMDGFALAKELRRSPNTKNMPIIMITSRTADKHREYAIQLGVNTYLGKPYQEDELLQNIADFLAVHK